MRQLFSFRTRNWRSFNLRALLLGVTFIAVACGAVARFYMPFQRQHAAIAQLQGRYKFITTSNGGPEWIRRLFGDKHFQNVTSLHVEGQQLSDDDLRVVTQLPYLEKLYLANNPITDQGLVHVRGLAHLRRLSLHSTKVEGAGYEHLATCPQLAEIDAHDLPITEAGMTALAKLSNLTWFVAPREVDEPALLLLDQFPRPEAINYREQQIWQLKVMKLTDAGIDALQKEGVPARVEIVGSNFTAAGWKKLFAGQHIKVVELRNTILPAEIIAEILNSEEKCAIETLGFDGSSLPFGSLVEILARQRSLHGSLLPGMLFFTRERNPSELASDPSGGLSLRDCFACSEKTTRCYSRPGNYFTEAELYHLMSRVQFETLTVRMQMPGIEPLIAEQKRVKHLRLEGTANGDALRAAGQLPQLKVLRCDRVAEAVSDNVNAIEELDRLVELEELHLPHGQAPGKCFGFLAKMPKLKKLNLTANRLDAGALEVIGKLPALEVLYLDHCGEGVNDEALAGLVRSNKLRELHCRATGVTEGSLALFDNLPALRIVDVQGTKIPPDLQQEVMEKMRSRSQATAVTRTPSSAKPGT